MKRFISTILFLSLLLLSGCGRERPPESTQTPYPSNTESPTSAAAGTPSPTQATSPAEENSNALNIEALRDTLQNAELTVSDDLISLFYNYYNMTYDEITHSLELRLLPSFDRGETPQWDALTHFIFYPADKEKTENGGYFIPRENLKAAVNRFFPSFEYTDRDSDFLQYTNGGYVPVGWDDNGSVFYRLTRISKDADGVYKAMFDGFWTNETDFWPEEESVSHNAKAIFEAAGVKEFSSSRDVSKVMLQILLRDDYAEILELGEQVSIAFKLSDDPDYAFQYLSCERTRLNE
jgi:hypothetical protein